MAAQASSIQQRKLWKVFLIFLLPLIATNILQSLSGTINTIFVGQMMGVEAIAAVSVFFPILFCLMAFIIGLSAGCTVLIGQAWGARNTEKLHSIVGSTLFMTLTGGTIIAALGALFTPAILRLLGTDQSVMHLAVPYTRWMLAGSPLLFIYIIYTSILRGVGDSITPLVALGMTSAIGMIITPVLIKGMFGFPSLGIISPAIATYISYCCVLGFLYLYLKFRNHPLKLDQQLRQHIRFDRQMCKLILKLGIPTGIQMVTTSLAGLVIIGMVNRFGAHATAAYGAVNQVLNYVQFPALSIGIAASIFAAQAIGADQIGLVRKVTRTALWFNLILTGGLISLAYLGSKALMSLFITEPTVVELGESLLHIVLWSLLFFGAAGIFAGIMRASGTVIAPMVINILCIVSIEIPLAWWFSHLWGLQGIWYGYATAFVATFFLQMAYYLLVWKKKSISRLV
ncbi:MATE family efflux transporter [Acinetobacter qingfengensis]|uniref:MATE family efflux transporter n=1 Tax=Acinetobacter qingfengensis TaxID=1262585 RepID=A0A1E7R502_9GAMM|nr:MATE family efflux transporter [Acinetobacter qingfengensis]KAA8732391.1 MATE family efflux transporter [Acinetobacter qingfengensis]OEY94386.1 MATE family efflux transporter [Acinetobacter qingfengensis]